MTHRILIVDDEPRLRESLSIALRRSGYECTTASNGKEALHILERELPDVIVTDWKMPELNGLELLKEVHKLSEKIRVIMMTAYADVPSTIAAFKEGVFDYLTKPFDNDELRAIVARACEIRSLEKENTNLRREVAEKFGRDAIVAASPKTRDLLDLVRKIALSSAPVLVLGESGTGKELIARLIHHSSARVGKPFVAVNCKAFSESVLESELFGHERGAFTGAHDTRLGCFERANNGTLFLDEIGEISSSFQGKLLRVLQEKEVQRVGGSEPKKIDVRVVTATNRNLKEDIRLGSFREDLYFRLNVLPVIVPPLRERREDIVPIADYFLSEHFKQTSKQYALSPEAQSVLENHFWPGNIRELKNAIERAVILARTNEIVPEDLLLNESTSREERVSKADSPAYDSNETLQVFLDRMTEDRIRSVLIHTDNKLKLAADILGIERTTLYRLMKKLGI